ncbi:MAG: hypothetical protein WBQ59_23225 [Candidatus Acidiferrum sp.]
MKDRRLAEPVRSTDEVIKMLEKENGGPIPAWYEAKLRARDAKRESQTPAQQMQSFLGRAIRAKRSNGTVGGA